MRDAPTVQPYRTATAASAITAVVTILFCVMLPAYSAASSAVTALIIAMFAHSEHHCSATLPAIYFLLSATVPMSRLLIIIFSSAFCYFFHHFLNACTQSGNRYHKQH